MRWIPDVDYHFTAHSTILKVHLYRFPMFFAGYRLHRVQPMLRNWYEATWITGERK